MAETITTPTTAELVSRRNEKVGLVTSTKMQKTIVVEIEMRKAHPKYKRVMKSNKKFYAHDEQGMWSASGRLVLSRSSSGGRSKRSCGAVRLGSLARMRRLHLQGSNSGLVLC